MPESQVNKKHKDRLLNFIFGSEENKAWTLSLYNAVNGSEYTDPSLIEFTTLKDALFMGMKNDTSFLIADTLSVYEHQSTYCPNMPLRLLEYVNSIYSGHIAKNKLNKYGSKLIMLPTPKLVVLYNGTKEMPDESVLKLSDSFAEDTKESADIEVKVRMINVNYGRNESLLATCKPLYEYSWLINEIRISQAGGYEIKDATRKAVKAMPDEFLIKEFLIVNLEEVEGMLDTEYNEAEVMELFKEEGRAEGKIEGKQEGRIEGISGTVNILKDMDISETEIIQKICKQYNLTEEEAKKYM